jgi:hypothetical protein
MTTAVTPVDATGHAAIHNVSINAAHFPINQRHDETSTKLFQVRQHYKQMHGAYKLSEGYAKPYFHKY